MKGRILLGAALLGAVGTAALSTAAQAELIKPRDHDTILLKNGEVYRGPIIQDDKEARQVWIKLADRRVRTPVSYDDIKEIRYQQTLKQAYEEAKKETSKSDLKRRLALAAECVQKKLVDEAIEDLGVIAKDFVRNYEVREQLVGTLLDAGKPAEALAAANEAVDALGADNLSVYILLGNAYVALGKLKEADAAFDKAGRSPRAMAGKGKAYLAMGKVEKALELFESILGDNPKDFDALVGAGRASLAMANSARAAEYFGQAAGAKRGRAEPFIGMGAALYVDRQFDAAATILNEALNLAPHSSEAYCTLGLVSLMKGDHSEAAKKLMEAVRESSVNGRAHIGMGVIFRALGEEEAAVDSFRRAAQAAERDAFCRFVYADALLAGGKQEEALKEYKVAAELSPELPQALLAVGALSILTENFTEAGRWYEKVVKVAPKDPHGHSGLGLALLGQGRLEEANVSLRRALMIDELNPQALLGLAWIANKGLREEEALGYMQEVLNRQPDNKYAIESLTSIYRNRGQEMEYHSFSGADLPSGWMQRQSFGVRLKIELGRLGFIGRQRGARQGQTYLQREVQAGRFIRFGAEVTPVSDTSFEGGLFLKCARGSIQLVRMPSGRVAYRYRDRNGVQPWAELADWRVGESMRLQIVLEDREKFAFKVVAGATESKPFIVDTFLASGRYYAGVYTASELNIDIDMKVDNLFVVKMEK